MNRETYHCDICGALVTDGGRGSVRCVRCKVGPIEYVGQGRWRRSSDARYGNREFGRDIQAIADPHERSPRRSAT